MLDLNVYGYVKRNYLPQNRKQSTKCLVQGVHEKLLCYALYDKMLLVFQASVSKAEELVLLHQEYQRGLHMFEDWLEQEQSSLALLSPLDEEISSLENTLKELQVCILMSFYSFFILS